MLKCLTRIGPQRSQGGRPWPPQRRLGRRRPQRSPSTAGAACRVGRVGRCSVFSQIIGLRWPPVGDYFFDRTKSKKHRSCRKYAWIAPVTDHRKFRKNIHMCAMWSHKMQMVDLAGFTQHSKYVSSIVCLSETWKAMAKMAAEMCSCVRRRNYLGGQRNVIAAFGNTRPPKHRKLRPGQAQNGTELVKLTPNGSGNAP